VNWLAHIYLSEPTPEFRLGNILPDFARPNELQHLPAEIQRGIVCHHRIDAFTDRHPIVRKSICRIPTPHRRFAPILIDLIYDHFLAANWSEFSEIPLKTFNAEVYQSFQVLAVQLPKFIVEALAHMAEQDWLTSYSTLDGVELALARISKRFSKPVDLCAGFSDIESNYDAIEIDFRAFFPELRAQFSDRPSPLPHERAEHPDHAASR
jgi:acyl carrier protein phosphodiesterase